MFSRETALLIDPKNSCSSSKQWVALVVGHELAHQWFGNLVTMVIIHNTHQLFVEENTKIHSHWNILYFLTSFKKNRKHQDNNKREEEYPNSSAGTNLLSNIVSYLQEAHQSRMWSLIIGIQKASLFMLLNMTIFLPAHILWSE